MKPFEGPALFTRASTILGICCCAIAVLLAACGGDGGMGYMAPSAPMAATPLPAASITLSVAPTTVMVGQTATVTWSSNSGTTCMASGAWSGSKTASGTATVTPTAAGTLNYMLSCSGGAYSASTTQTATLTVDAVTAFSQTDLVSNGTVMAATTDANLVNPWGLALAPTGPMWVANNGTQTSTLYDGTGINQSLVVAIPPPSAGPANPTGIVFNSSSDFAISKNGGAPSPALFIFSGEGGAISGWSQSVDPLNAVTAYDDGAGGAVYKGLAIANNGSANFLYATDFHNNKVDVFDKSFTKVVSSGGFTDPALPAGYAPFGIQAVMIGTTVSIVVTYAQQDSKKQANVSGAGLGLVDIFDTNGKFLQHLVATGGALNSPWGVALAPAGFGNLAKTLLIGNFGDGVINGYDPASGAFVGSVNDSNGKPLANPGLWGIVFGNGAFNQPVATLYFAAGISAQTAGLYGRIDPGATPPDTVAPKVTLSNAAGTVSGTVALTATATDNVGVSSVKFYAGTALVGTATKAPFTVQWDTSTVANGAYQLTAKAADAAGNTTTSAAVAVTVSNTAAPPAPPPPAPPPPPPGY
jgi:uncharacterized protein (TIGR03118 family)